MINDRYICMCARMPQAQKGAEEEVGADLEDLGAMSY